MIARSLAPGRRVYAVGDVHGCADRLFALHGQIAQDLAGRPVDSPLLLHLGDLIDRGADSARLVASLASADPIPGVPTVTLMGNHEWMMLTALASGTRDAAEHWLDNGGVQALESWGVEPGTSVAEWARVIPRSHLLYLRDRPSRFELDGLLFVHAGVRPGVPLAQQARTDLLWMREPFLSWEGALLPDRDMRVVHGHTPVPAPDIRPYQVNLDTGAVRGGPLTCGVFEEGEVRLLQA